MPPTFKEVRHIINIATVHGVAPVLKMVTFDADDTIYEDGGTVGWGRRCVTVNETLGAAAGVITMGSPMVNIIVRLLRQGIFVALVTAAGYPGQVPSIQRFACERVHPLSVLSRLCAA